MSIHSRSRSASPAFSDTSSGFSMPMLRKETEENPEEGSSDRRSRASSSMSSEYRFRLQLLNDNSNDIPPPISPNSTAFDPVLRRGQVKIIRTGDTMHVMTYEDCGKPMITSYAKPLSQSWYETSPRPRLDTSPIRPNFKFEGESAIKTISRYCFQSCIEAQLDNLTLQEILVQAQLLAEKWINARDSGLNESQRQFLKQFRNIKLETVVMKDWETLSDIFEAHNEWKIEQNRLYSSPNVQEVSYKRSACLKTLPRHRLAKKRKQDLKNYESFVDLGERIDLGGLRKKRGMTHTFVLNTEKVGSLLRKSMFYGSNDNTIDIKKKKYDEVKVTPVSKAKSKTQVKSAKKKAIRPKSSKSDASSDKLNPRRDKPMAKIRSQVRQVDRFARLNGESYHNAALTLSKNRGLAVSGSPSRKISPQDLELLRQARTQDSEVNLQETDLDLGLEGVCFDADLTELTNSVMVGNVLEDLEGLERDPVELNFANTSEPSGSMVVALHAGIDYGSEFPEPFTSKSFPDIVSMDDGLMEAIDTTLGADLDVSNLMESNPSNAKEEIFLMTGLTPAEHKAFENLEHQLIEDSNQRQRPDSKSKSPETADNTSSCNSQTPTTKPVSTTAPTPTPTTSLIDPANQNKSQNGMNTVTTVPNSYADNNNETTTMNKLVHTETELTQDLNRDILTSTQPPSLLPETTPPSLLPETTPPSLLPETTPPSPPTKTKISTPNNEKSKDDPNSKHPHQLITVPPSKSSSSSCDTMNNHSNPLSILTLPKVSDTSTEGPTEVNTDTQRPGPEPRPELARSRRIVRRSMPAKLITCPETPTSTDSTNNTNVSAKKAQTLLECSLTGSYWQIPENKFPCNRPKRANAGALMTTSSKLRRKENNVNHSDSGGKQRNAKNSRVTIKIVAGKFTNKSLHETSLSPDGMIVSKKTAVRCVTCIPDFICPTPHEEFLLKYRKWFSEADLKELQELIMKSRPKIELAASKCGMDKYLRSLAKKNKGREEQQAAAIAALNSVINPPENKDLQATEVKPKANQTAKSVPPVKEKESVPKPRAYSSKRKFEEDEKTEITKLGSNQILVDGVILKVDHENYVKEKDIEIPYDDYNFETKENLPCDPATVTAAGQERTDNNPKPKGLPCKLPYCTLGCVCQSIDSQVSEAKLHCGKVKCMLECSCNVANWNKEDADIRSRLRPRVSMLNWSSRLNYLDAYISPDKEKEPVTKSSDSRANTAGQVPSGRIKRNIVPPKRNNDFVSHLKKGRDELVRPSTRQVSKISAFKHIGNKLRLKQRQRQPFLRPLKNANVKEETIIRGKRSSVARLKLDESTKSSLTPSKNTKDEIDTTSIIKPAVSRLSNLQKRSIRQRTLIQSSLDAVRSRAQFNGVGISVEGTGPLIPPELMAKFAPFMEIRFRPKPDKTVPLVSESEDSTDDENDEEYANLTYKMNPNPVIMQEEAFSTPVIVSYTSCQEGFSQIIHPENPE